MEAVLSCFATLLKALGGFEHVRRIHPRMFLQVRLRLAFERSQSVPSSEARSPYSPSRGAMQQEGSSTNVDASMSDGLYAVVPLTTCPHLIQVSFSSTKLLPAVPLRTAIVSSTQSLNLALFLLHPTCERFDAVGSSRYDRTIRRYLWAFLSKVSSVPTVKAMQFLPPNMEIGGALVCAIFTSNWTLS